MLEFAGRFSDPNLVLKQGKFWTIIFRENIVTLGDCVLILNRQCPSLSSVTAAEMSEFPKMCALAEDCLKTLFGAVKFNYIAMMMKENFVHFHLIPRYDQNKEKLGFTFVDSTYPKGADLTLKLDVPAEIKEQIKAEMKSYFDQQNG